MKQRGIRGTGATKDPDSASSIQATRYNQIGVNPLFVARMKQRGIRDIEATKNPDSASSIQATRYGVTQFGRALTDLNIDIICANSPQAKGRVERVNRTLQDRLIKEMRLLNIFV